MSRPLALAAVAPLLDLPPKHLEDAAWLRSLPLRRGAAGEFSRSASAGDMERFGAALGASLNRFHDLKKSQRKRLLTQLLALWEPALLAEGGEHLDAASLAACLFSHDPEDVCGRVEAIIASHTEVLPEHDTLMAALWLMQARPRHLGPRTLFSLWRWSLQAGQAFVAHAATVLPDSGLSSLRALEAQLLVGDAAAELKGARRCVKNAIRGFRDSLEAATDTDGTPHADALPDLLGALACLGRVTLLDRPGDEALWDKGSRARLTELCGRSLSLFSPRHLAFQDDERSPEVLDDETDQRAFRQHLSSLGGHRLRTMQAVAAAFGMPKNSGTVRLLRRWEREAESEHSGKSPRISQWSLPNECHQSDWAEWACLRSGWEGAADTVILVHDSAVPRLDVVVQGLPLFSGEWSHRLSVDGRAVSTANGWSCVCWYCDDDAAFVELEQQLGGWVKIIRQACLVRQEQLLLLADSIRCDQAERIDYLRALPLTPHWTSAADVVTREAALFWEDSETVRSGRRHTSGSRRKREDHAVRLRLVPLTSPQERIMRSDETFTVADRQLLTRHTCGSSQAYVATIFDWSEKRRDRPVDWCRLTVAEEGAILPSSVAVAYRLRIGRQQWLLYHSQVPPRVPRTVLGVHTSSETVFGRLTAQGDFEPLVEVEI